jgi:hypothetical protein
MMTQEKKPQPTELIDALLADCKKPEDLKHGISAQVAQG